ncbi:flagellar protein FlaF [Azospirillum agricola]|uniref:flagellar biosynthesis regulator FlaF n=1 Tax=Azospirillum agricola TaxID=1720247 RepID=UPI001AEB73AE|nr:flagellar biosynthesis regulator FlaF [Azospirillum agricola]MBP2228986.1 flagellar protein FlaF [Azospirillum agricola]
MKPTPTYANKPTSDNPRDVEAWALAEAARRLISAGHARDAEALQAALQLNQRLWTIFQAAITEEDCGHPPEVRTNIAALSLLVDRETTARLIDLDFDKLETLVSVNRAVASGLTAQGEFIAQQAAQQAAASQAPAPQGPAGLRPAAGAMPRPPMAPAATPDSPPVNRESLRISI